MNCPCTSSGNCRENRNSLPTAGRMPSLSKTGSMPRRPDDFAPDSGESQCCWAPVPSPTNPWPQASNT